MFQSGTLCGNEETTVCAGRKGWRMGSGKRIMCVGVNDCDSHFGGDCGDRVCPPSHESEDEGCWRREGEESAEDGEGGQEEG